MHVVDCYRVLFRSFSPADASPEDPATSPEALSSCEKAARWEEALCLSSSVLGKQLGESRGLF